MEKSAQGPLGKPSIGAASKLKSWRLTSNKSGTAQVGVVYKAQK